MALSDHEKRMLAEMEAALVADDPHLVSTLNGRERTSRGSRAGLVLFLSNLSFGKSEFKSPKGARNKWSSRLEDRWERRNFDN